MTLAATIEHAITQLQALKGTAEEMDKIKQQSTTMKSKISDLEGETKRLEETKAKLLKDVTELRQQVEVLRGEKLAERQARQKVVEEANAKVKALSEEITAKQGQRDEISGAIAQLRSRFG
jgi:sulfate adenylyltransferase subunit 1 (EFTu-like GTPase family)